MALYGVRIERVTRVMPGMHIIEYIGYLCNGHVVKRKNARWYHGPSSAERAGKAFTKGTRKYIYEVVKHRKGV